MGAARLLPFIDKERLKEISVLLNNGKFPLFAGYELLKYKTFNLDIGVGVNYATIGISKTLKKLSNLSIGVYTADTYKNIFSNKFNIKYGIGLGIKF